MFEIVNTFQKQVFHCNTKYLSTTQTIKTMFWNVVNTFIPNWRCSIIVSLKYLCASQTIAGAFRNFLRRKQPGIAQLRITRLLARSRFRIIVSMYYANELIKFQRWKVCHRLAIWNIQFLLTFNILIWCVILCRQSCQSLTDWMLTSIPPPLVGHVIKTTPLFVIYDICTWFLLIVACHVTSANQI